MAVKGYVILLCFPKGCGETFFRPSPIGNRLLGLRPQNLQVRVQEYFKVNNNNSNCEITQNSLKVDG